MSSQDLPPLLSPFELRGVTFRNRVLVSPMCQYCAEDGFVNDWHLAHYGRFALGGAAGAVVEATSVTSEGRITPGCLGIWKDAHVPGLKRIVAFFRRQKVKIGIQLAHSGRKGSAAVPLAGAQPLIQCAPQSAWETVAPTALPLGESWPTPRELTGVEVEQTVAAFVDSARRAVTAGFDFIEIHGAHGYLIHSFLAALSNRRADEWGGSYERRMRFPLAIAAAVREAVPIDMPILYRTSSVDGVEGGMTLEDTVTLARALKLAGVDLIDCSSGGITGASGRATRPPGPGYLVPYARAVREQTGLPTMAVGLIMHARQADDIIRDGSADLVAIGREMLVDPNFAYRAAEELGHPEPSALLPDSYAFFLRRRVF